MQSESGQKIMVTIYVDVQQALEAGQSYHGTQVYVPSATVIGRMSSEQKALVAQRVVKQTDDVMRGRSVNYVEGETVHVPVPYPDGAFGDEVFLRMVAEVVERQERYEQARLARLQAEKDKQQQEKDMLLAMVEELPGERVAELVADRIAYSRGVQRVMLTEEDFGCRGYVEVGVRTVLEMLANTNDVSVSYHAVQSAAVRVMSADNLWSDFRRIAHSNVESRAIVATVERERQHQLMVRRVMFDEAAIRYDKGGNEYATTVNKYHDGLMSKDELERLRRSYLFRWYDQQGFMRRKKMTVDDVDVVHAKGCGAYDDPSFSTVRGVEELADRGLGLDNEEYEVFVRARSVAGGTVHYEEQYTVEPCVLVVGCEACGEKLLQGMFVVAVKVGFLEDRVFERHYLAVISG
jgi:hypothetical protein